MKHASHFRISIQFYTRKWFLNHDLSKKRRTYLKKKSILRKNIFACEICELTHTSSTFGYKNFCISWILINGVTLEQGIKKFTLWKFYIKGNMLKCASGHTDMNVQSGFVKQIVLLKINNETLFYCFKLLKLFLFLLLFFT